MLSADRREEAFKVSEIRQGGTQLGAGLPLWVMGPRLSAFQCLIEEEAAEASFASGSV